ncbi:mannosyl-oligosaccharide alpha-1,2-mannosidase-like protein [Cryomyces antarcticus]
MASFRRNPSLAFKTLTVTFIIGFYVVYTAIHGSLVGTAAPPKQARPKIQYQGWSSTKLNRGYEDGYHADEVRLVMLRTFQLYRAKSWGCDDIEPVSGKCGTSMNGWGGFIIDTTTTLALMGLWDELLLEIEHITSNISFNTANGLVDPHETTSRYLGALVSLADTIDSRTTQYISHEDRDAILLQAIRLARKLAPSFDSPTGMPWPRIDFSTNKGISSTPVAHKGDSKPSQQNGQAVDPASIGSSFLENRYLSHMTGNAVYHANVTTAWAPMVWNKYVEDWPGLIDAPIDISAAEPLGRERHWDAGHSSYYSSLIKAAILAPADQHSQKYSDRWLQAAEALRHHLVSRSTPSRGEGLAKMQHLYMGKWHNGWYLNEQSQAACSTPGILMLGGRYLGREDLVTFGQALLEACHHTYNSTPTGLGPQLFSWLPNIGYLNGTYEPQTAMQQAELEKFGFWVADPSYKLRPEYAESLFYAWRITGEQRYRNWAWEAFTVIQKHCKAPYGYAGIKNVMVDPTGRLLSDVELVDESVASWGETLKYFYLIFADVEKGSLDRWVYSTGGHPFRMIG